MNEFLDNIEHIVIELHGVTIEIVKFKDDFFQKLIKICNEKILLQINIPYRFGIEFKFKNNSIYRFKSIEDLKDNVLYHCSSKFNSSNDIINDSINNINTIDCYFRCLDTNILTLQELEKFDLKLYEANLVDPFKRKIKPNENVLVYYCDKWVYCNYWIKTSKGYYFYINNKFEAVTENIDEMPSVIKITDIEKTLFLLQN